MPAVRTKEPPKLSFGASVRGIDAILRHSDEHADEFLVAPADMPMPYFDALITSELQLLGDSVEERSDALVATIQRLEAEEYSYKARKDALGQWEKSRRSAKERVRAYLKYWTKILFASTGGTRIDGRNARVTIRQNPKPSVDCSLDNAALLEIADFGSGFYDGDRLDVAEAPAHPLVRYMTIERVVKLDKDAIARDYEAARQLLEAETPYPHVSEVPAAVLERVVANALLDPQDESLLTVLMDLRATRILDALAQQFPGITVTRGDHLRIDQVPGGATSQETA